MWLSRNSGMLDSGRRSGSRRALALDPDGDLGARRELQFAAGCAARAWPPCLTDDQLLGNLSVGVTARDQLRDLSLARAERVRRRPVASLRRCGDRSVTSPCGLGHGRVDGQRRALADMASRPGRPCASRAGSSRWSRRRPLLGWHHRRPDRAASPRPQPDAGLASSLMLRRWPAPRSESSANAVPASSCKSWFTRRLRSRCDAR